MVARLRAADTVSSLLFSGFFEYLLSEKGSLLRSQFVFYLVPVVNPDGVEAGNALTNLSGKSLARHWRKGTSSVLVPELTALNTLME